MNEELSDAIIESVHDIFHGFLALEVFPGEAEQGTNSSDEIATVVGFQGVLRGSIIVRASRATALTLACALAGRSLEGVSGEFYDLYGELADLIAGGIRTRLSAHGEIHLAPPTMVAGYGYTLKNARIFSSVQEHFQVNGGQFSVECFFLKDFS